MDNISLGKTIEHLCQSHGINMEELSRRSGVSKSILSKIKNGRNNVELKTLSRISARGFGIGILDFFRVAERISMHEQ